MRDLRQDPARVLSLSGWDFERAIGEILVSFGWEINGPSRVAGREIDLLGISRDTTGFETTWAIETKCCRDGRKIGAVDVAMIYARTHSLGLQQTMLVTNSQLTQRAADAAAMRGILV